MIFFVTTNPQNLFTLGSVATLTASATIVYTSCGVIQNVFNFSPKWLALAISMLLSFIACYVGITMTNKIPEKDMSDEQLLMHSSIWLNYLFAIFNGFLIYATATGSNQLFSSTTQHPIAPVAAATLKRSFNSNWWK